MVKHLVAGLIVLMMLATQAFSETIQLVQSGGVYMVPVRINDAVVIPFILDSGAAEVVIPADVFSVLSRSGTMSQSDFKGAGKYTIADGSTVSSDRYVLHKVTVGDHVITDVIANVAATKSEPLLGQSFLQRLPAWTLDNSRHALVLKNEGHTTGDQPKTVTVPSPPEPGTERGKYYMTSYFLLGTYLRAAVVCNNKSLVDFGFSFVDSKEFRAFSAAYPKTYEKWMMEGAGNFNSAVMNNGISDACKFVTSRMQRG